MKPGGGIEAELAVWHEALGQGTFEAQVAALEAVVGRLEDGGLALGDSIALYELGMELASSAKGTIEAAELRVRALSWEQGTDDPQARLLDFPTPDDGEDGDGEEDDTDDTPF